MTKNPTPQPLFDTLENTTPIISGKASPPYAPIDYQCAFEFLNQYRQPSNL